MRNVQTCERLESMLKRRQRPVIDDNDGGDVMMLVMTHDYLRSPYRGTSSLVDL